MFRVSLCPSSGDRLHKTASGVSLDVLAADCVESGQELSALCECRYLHSHSVLSSCPDSTQSAASTSRLTPDAVLCSLSPDDGHNDARNTLS